MLTTKQRDLLKFINDETNKRGVPPSFEEMKDALNLKSKSGIHRLIMALEERGFVKRLAHRARAIEVLKTPKIFNDKINYIKSEIKETVKGKNLNVEALQLSEVIPLIGKIAAGTPIEAIQSNVDQVSVPKQMIGVGQHFALQVEGDSMIDLGINAGDTAIIKEQSYANNGEIVVALIDGQEATLKTIRKKLNTIELEPANSIYEIQKFATNRVEVQGRLVGLLRSYN
mgnify:CR=1 FL=1